MSLLVVLLLALYLVLAALVGVPSLPFALPPDLNVPLLAVGVVGGLVGALVAGELPFGLLGAVGAGLLGAWLGPMVLGPVGPEVAGVAIVPPLAGALAVVLLAHLVARGTVGRTEGA